MAADQNSGRAVFSAMKVHVPSDVVSTFRAAEITQETPGFIDAAKLYAQMQEIRAMQTGAAAANLAQVEAGPDRVGSKPISPDAIVRT